MDPSLPERRENPVFSARSGSCPSDASGCWSRLCANSLTRGRKSWCTTLQVFLTFRQLAGCLISASVKSVLKSQNGWVMGQIKSRYGRFYGLIPQTCWTLCSILHFNELIAFRGFYWRQSCWDAWIFESAKPTFICVCWRLYIHLPATSLCCLLHTSTAVTESNLRI